MGNQGTNTPATDTRLGWLYKGSAMAAVLVAVLLLASALILAIRQLQPAGAGGWLTALQDNWLIVIFKLHAGFGGAHLDQLRGVDVLDIIILALVGLVCLGLYAALSRTSKVWSVVGAVQPFLGILLFLATANAGRSAAMGAALVMSLVMLWSGSFQKQTASMGILATVLLLAGDFSAGVIPPSSWSAALFAIGYLLFVAWFFLIARALFQLARQATAA